MDNNHNSFKKFVYYNVCQCNTQCIDLKIKDLDEIKNKNCTQITKGQKEYDENDYDTLINNALTYFIEQDILIKQGTKYYIMNPITKIKMRLNWENIKSIETVEIKELIWLLRKFIVDMLLKKLMTVIVLDIDFKVFSVGSTSLSSDYDITLYGDNKSKLYIIKGFQKEFTNLFNDDSAVVFDTNIYGKAYISFIKDAYFTEELQDFYYMKPTPIDSQTTWSLIKYLSNLRDAFGEYIYNDMVSFMTKKIPQFYHLNVATKTMIYLRNKDSSKVNYDNLFNIENAFLKRYKDKLLGMSDYISLINFYGIETYFTRGAFMDTVVNNQMCKKDAIPLNDSDYLASILENAGFFFLHNNKTKYIKRVQTSITNLISKYSVYKVLLEVPELQELNKIFGELGSDPDKNYCKWTSDTDFNLMKCEKFSMFNIILKVIFKLLQIYSIEHPTTFDKDNFPFYFEYVSKNTQELGSSILSTPIFNVKESESLSLSSLFEQRESTIS